MREFSNFTWYHCNYGSMVSLSLDPNRLKSGKVYLDRKQSNFEAGTDSSNMRSSTLEGSKYSIIEAEMGYQIPTL